MIECRQVQETLLSALQNPETETEAVRHLIRIGAVTPEVHTKLKQYLEGAQVEIGLSIIEETGYGDDQYILGTVRSVLQGHYSDEAQRIAANILRSRANRLDGQQQEEWARLLRETFNRHNSEARESIIRAIRALKRRDTETIQFFLEITNSIRYTDGERIQAAMGLAEMGYSSLVIHYLTWIAQTCVSSYWFEALNEMILFGCLDWCYTEAALDILDNILANYWEFASYMDEVVNCMKHLEQSNFDSFVPFMLDILRQEDDSDITQPIIDVLSQRGVVDEIITKHLRQWLTRQNQPTLWTRALIYLARLGEITEQDIDRVGVNIKWDKIAEELQRNNNISLSPAVRKKLVEISRLPQQHPQHLRARVCLGEFSQADFSLVVEMLNFHGFVEGRSELPGILAELWYQMGCHQKAE